MTARTVDLPTPTGRYATVPDSRARPRLPAGWPFLAMLFLAPLWYVLGLGAFIWIILAVPMLAHLMLARKWRAPGGFILWLFFLLWTALSALQLHSAGNWFTFSFRAGAYIAAGLGFLYLVNTDEKDLPTYKIIMALTFFWAVIVAGGYVALALPHLSFSTPFQKILPGSFLSNRYLHDLVHPSLSQAQALGGVRAIGHAITRPAAPFPYTNQWGGTYAFLTPFVLLAVRRARSRRVRVGLGVLVVISLVPFVISINRGAWLSLIVAALYAWIRFAFRRNLRSTLGLLLLLAVVTLAILVTPLRGVVLARLGHHGSTSLRLELYHQSGQSALQSPWIGYGVPLPQPVSRYSLPNVGTQGQLWLVLVSVGFPGTFFFLAWLLYLFWKTRSLANEVGFAAHLAILIALVQLPLYGWMPAEMFLLMAAGALVWRRRDADGTDDQPLQTTPSTSYRPLPTTPSAALPAV
jgi:polysaccharide biosynthesis protein PslJ